jgi:hypothetical protein
MLPATLAMSAIEVCIVLYCILYYFHPRDQRTLIQEKSLSYIKFPQ